MSKSFLFGWCWLLSTVYAKRNLIATSMVACMENSLLTSNSFDVVFNPDDTSLHYNLDLTTEIDSYIIADIDVFAYGFKIINKKVDLCDIGWKQFCPTHPGRIEIEAIEYISEDLTEEIPNIAYQVPDIDAYAKVQIYNKDNTSEYLACIQVYFSNGKTVSQTGVKWATAVIAGIGLLLSATLSTFGNSVAASHIGAMTMSLFLYFQSVVVVAMEHVHRVPPIASSWAENLAWSMGLIQIKFMQKIFRWFVEATGGTPSLYLTSTVESVLAQKRKRTFTYDNIKNSVQYLMKRAEGVIYGNQYTIIFRGIKRMGFLMGIENTSIVCTGFTFFVLCGYVLAGFIIVVKYSTELCVKAGWMKPRKFIEFRLNWKLILKGALLRYIYIGFTQLTILALWEFTERDSAAVIVIACLFLLLVCGIMIWSAYRTFYFARKSIQKYNNPAAILYGNNFVLHKYGFFYTMFDAKYYWWNVVLLSYLFIKSLFIGLAQASGMTQALAIFILDLAYFIVIIRYKPYLDKPTNVINILISTVNLINAFLFMFFSDLFGQRYAVSAVMAWVFFILNAAFSLILLLMIIVFVLIIIFSKHPSVRFKPAKDDRTSFHKRLSIKDDNDNNYVDYEKGQLSQLAALGDAAKMPDGQWDETAVGANVFEYGHDSEDVFVAHPILSSSSEGDNNSPKGSNNNNSSEPSLRQLRPVISLNDGNIFDIDNSNSFDFENENENNTDNSAFHDAIEQTQNSSNLYNISNNDENINNEHHFQVNNIDYDRSINNVQNTATNLDKRKTESPFCDDARARTDSLLDPFDDNEQTQRNLRDSHSNSLFVETESYLTRTNTDSNNDY